MLLSSLIKAIGVVAIVMATSLASAEKAVFAGGCFWCMESDFQDVEGVLDVVSGFTGGDLKNPTYKGNHQGHYEAVEISYDPSKISYQELLALYWPKIDPFDSRGQFCDKGSSYLSAVFVIDDEQRALAEVSREKIIKQFAGQKVVTPILSASTFWPVEDYHQDYYKKNPVRYKYYRYRCGRDARLQEIWGS